MKVQWVFVPLVVVRTSATLKLSLAYVVYGTSWSPVYDLRVDTTTREIGLTYSAMISQGSSEDWGDVVLELSTSQPHVGGSHPELPPWKLREHRPQMHFRKHLDTFSLTAAPMMRNAYKAGRADADDAMADAGLTLWPSSHVSWPPMG